MLYDKKHGLAGVPVLITLLLFFCPTPRQGQAAFTLNFIPDDGNYTSTNSLVNYSCNMSYISDFNCASGGRRGDFQLNGSHDDGSAAYQRTFSSNGKNYYHVIIGDYTQDSFYMEYIVEANSGWGSYNGGFAPASASTGNTSSNNELYNMTQPYDANSALSGTGTGNPTRVIMRQVLDDGVTYGEFLKDQFDKKPYIAQTITDTNPTEGITNSYKMDMRGKGYSDSTPISFAENTTFLIGNTAANQGDYDNTYSVPTPIRFRQGNATISAGAYTYTDGSEFGGSSGTYTYYLPDGVTVDGSGFQPVNKDYSVFCIDSQNTDWSGNGACVNGDGTTGGRRGGGGWGGW